MANEIPNTKVLLKQLEIEWQDHIQTRKQTWQTVFINLIILSLFIYLGLHFNNLIFLSMIFLLVVLLNIFFFSLTFHHRKSQVRKFTHIDNIEKTLGLHIPELLADVHPPHFPKGTDIFKFSLMNTPIFILRVHIIIQLIELVYFIYRIYHIYNIIY